MAVLTIGGIATSVHGSIGGTTFRSTGGKSVASKKVSKRKVRSQLPSAYISGRVAWSKLSPAERASWVTAAHTGGALPKTYQFGISAFVAFFGMAATLGLDFPLSAPAAPGTIITSPDISSLTIDHSAVTGHITLASGLLSDWGALIYRNSICQAALFYMPRTAYIYGVSAISPGTTLSITSSKLNQSPGSPYFTPNSGDMLRQSFYYVQFYAPSGVLSWWVPSQFSVVGSALGDAVFNNLQPSGSGYAPHNDWTVP